MTTITGQEMLKEVTSKAWRALLLDQAVYSHLANGKTPFRRGLTTLLLILVVVGMAQAVGLA